MDRQDTITAHVTVTAVIDTGAAFAVRHGTGDSCYIPATVVASSGAKAGDVANAHLIVNPTDRVRERTPYMVTFLDLGSQGQLPLSTPVPESGAKPSLAEQARQFTLNTMRDGGVWTGALMFEEFMGDGADRASHIEVYNTIARTLRKMFADGDCAKWVLYRTANQTKASKEWFGCYPEHVDVAEFEDADG